MWAKDNIDNGVKLLDGNGYPQVFSNGKYFSGIYPMDKKADYGK